MKIKYIQIQDQELSRKVFYLPDKRILLEDSGVKLDPGTQKKVDRGEVILIYPPYDPFLSSPESRKWSDFLDRFKCIRPVKWIRPRREYIPGIWELDPATQEDVDYLLGFTKKEVNNDETT